MAVNVNLVPVTGVTLPLVSMGGSSFLFTCAAIGIVLSVGRNVEQLEGKAPIETGVAAGDGTPSDGTSAGVVGAAGAGPANRESFSSNQNPRANG